jgi:hypothetical protein
LNFDPSFFLVELYEVIMRNLVLFFVGVIGSAHAMESFSGKVISDFLQGDYESAINRALELGKSSSSRAERDRSKLFLKELFPRMILEKKTFTPMQDRVTELLKGWDPATECQDYYKMIVVLYGKAEKRREILNRNAAGRKMTLSDDAVAAWQNLNILEEETDDKILQPPHVTVAQTHYSNLDDLGITNIPSVGELVDILGWK